MVSIEQIRKVLFFAQPKMIVFDPERGNNRLELLRQSIPEFYHCNSNSRFCSTNIFQMMTKMGMNFTPNTFPN
jgi:hypothetical protein